MLTIAYLWLKAEGWKDFGRKMKIKAGTPNAKS